MRPPQVRVSSWRQETKVGVGFADRLERDRASASYWIRISRNSLPGGAEDGSRSKGERFHENLPVVGAGFDEGFLHREHHHRLGSGTRPLRPGASLSCHGESGL